ncbi:uncharacterized protein [Watersipora subatra]|uniref:uncharacterized protein n=1 Tax=Watersipora subatra TaxID=2589382 RepID=UPI00355B5732
MKKSLLYIVLAGVFAVTSGTICYTCDDSDCDDAYDSPAGHEIQCYDDRFALENGGCSKAKSTAKIGGRMVSSVVRSCGDIYDNSQCANKDREIIKSDGYNYRVSYCSCRGDRCNGGLSLSFHVFSEFVILLISFFLF